MYLYVLTYLYYLWKNPAMQIQNKKKFKSIFQLKKNSDPMVCVWIFFSYISFICGEKWRKLPICYKSVENGYKQIIQPTLTPYTFSSIKNKEI
jgi:hypothetical protein